MQNLPKILLYGYGNPGRQDDGLGNAFIELISEWIQEMGYTHIQTDSNYQLNIEDAMLLAENDIVIFIDASEEPLDDYLLTTVCMDNARIEFTNHAVSAEAVYFLCHSLYNKNPEVYLFHIKGCEWEFKEELSALASENLYKAVEYIKNLLPEPSSIKEKAGKPLYNFRNN